MAPHLGGWWRVTGSGHTARQLAIGSERAEGGYARRSLALGGGAEPLVSPRYRVALSRRLAFGTRTAAALHAWSIPPLDPQIDLQGDLLGMASVWGSARRESMRSPGWGAKVE